MRSEKKSIVNELSGYLQDAEFTLLVDYKGLSVEEMRELRGGLRDVQGSMRVVKNSFLKKAAKDTGREEMGSIIDGSVAMITGRGDITHVVKIVTNFARTHERPSLRGGMHAETILSEDDVRALATLPGREVLLGKVVGTIAAPAANLVGVLHQKLSSLLYVLRAVEEKKK